MPADPGARRVLGHENLLEAAGRNAGECLGTGPNRSQKFRHVLSSGETTAIEIIAPAKRNGTALAGEAAEFKLPEWKRLDIGQKRTLFISKETPTDTSYLPEGDRLRRDRVSGYLRALDVFRALELTGLRSPRSPCPAFTFFFADLRRS